MYSKLSAVKNRGGRPRELKKPHQMHLYVEADFAVAVKRMAAALARERGEPVSISQAITAAVADSPLFQVAKRPKEK